MSAAAMRERLNTAETVNIWRAPDMAVLSSGRAKPITMPPEIFGEVWPLVCDLARGSGAPVAYSALGLVAACASLIGSKRWVRPFPTSSWAEPGILWVCNVGDPSNNKSPAVDPISDVLKLIELDHAEKHRDNMRDHEATLQRAKAERKSWEKDVEAITKEGGSTPALPQAAVMPDEPQRRRCVLNDPTPESVAAILSGNPIGTLLLRDELAGWLTSFDRYAPGGRSFWLESYGGRPFVVDRKGAAGPVFIPFNGVSVLGGIQPDRLVELLLSGVDDGLVARFLWTWPDPIPYVRPVNLADLGRLEHLMRRLDGLPCPVDDKGRLAGPRILLDPGAADIFEAWVRDHQAGELETSALYKGFCGKLKGMVLRLALTSELLRWADGNAWDEPKSISPATIVSVIEFVESYAKPTALQVFGDAALPPVERNAAALARYIVRSGLSVVNARDIKRSSSIAALKDAEALAAAVSVLIEADWLRPAPTRAGDTPGRARTDYLVNPAVLERKA